MFALPSVERLMGTDHVAEQDTRVRDCGPQQAHLTNWLGAAGRTFGVASEPLGGAERALCHGDPRTHRGHERVLAPPPVLAVMARGTCSGCLRQVELSTGPEHERLPTQRVALAQRVVRVSCVLLAAHEMGVGRVELESA